MKYYFLALLLLSKSSIVFGQDSLCYSNIDKIVTDIQDTKCSRLDTGFVSINSTSLFRECYITDLTGTELLAVMTSTRDSTYYSTHVNYYFYKKKLIKVELGDVDSYKKVNLINFYYPEASCQPFYQGKHLEALKVYHQRQAAKIVENWNRH